MAVSGLILIGFVIGHLVGNLQVFEHPDRINGYAQFLHNLGPLLWVARGVIILSAVVHIWAAVSLTLENRAARGPEAYGIQRTLRATLASRTMRGPIRITPGFVSIMAPMGDLVESMFKRNLDVKDFGTIVAGHGGVLDRFDSLILSIPFIWVYLMVK